MSTDIVTPGLMKYSGGDQSKAKSMQEAGWCVIKSSR